MTRASLEQLLSLYRPDELASGYEHVGLAYEIAKRLRPQTQEILARNLYPETAQMADLDQDARAVVVAAWHRYLGWTRDFKIKR